MYHCRLFAVLALAAGLELAQAQGDGVWTTAGGGSWAGIGNWLDGTIADSTDNTATFGFSLYPINASATFTLNGARTIGNLNFTAQTTPANWLLNTGTGGPLSLDSTFDFPALTVNPAGLQLTGNAVFAGVAGLEKFGAGTLILTATNTYTGGTVLSGGTLLVNGWLTDPNAVTVSRGTFGGTGMISGPLIVQAGGIFSPGGSPGNFIISNSLTLQTGSRTVIEVNASTLAHDSVLGISSVNYGGTLTVSNLAGTPVVGQSFPIFSAVGAAGNFSSITPQLTGGVRWRFDPASGSVSVISTNLQPKFAGTALLDRTNLLMFVTNGVPGATNYVLASTNLILLRTSWSRLATNVFDAGGNLVMSTAVRTNMSRFYMLSVP